MAKQFDKLNSHAIQILSCLQTCEVKYTTLTGPMKYPTLTSSISRLRVMELPMTVQIVSYSTCSIIFTLFFKLKTRKEQPQICVGELQCQTKIN